ncbi:MAG: OmpA family protein, partial [Pseudomonadota bacterium]
TANDETAAANAAAEQAETDAQIAELTATLAERDAAIEALEATLQEAEAAGAAETGSSDNEAELAALGSRVSELTEQVAVQSRTIQNLRLGLDDPDMPAQELAQVCGDRATAILEASQITFDTGTTSINNESAATLSELRDIAIGCATTDLIIEIGGHTDSQGAEASNQAISEARAQAVLDFMVDGGVSPESMRAVGFGETQPIADNDTFEGRAANRRITFEWQVRTTEPEIVDEATEAAPAEEPTSETADDAATDGDDAETDTADE